MHCMSRERRLQRLRLQTRNWTAAQQISNLEKRHNEELKELYEQIRSLEKQLMTLQTPTNVSGK